MIFQLAEDFAVVLSAIPHEHSKRRILILIQEALRRDLFFVDRHPTTFFQCMWNLCWWYDSKAAAAHFDWPEDGPPDTRPPWVSSDPKLHSILESWRRNRDRKLDRPPWLRMLRPPPHHLGTGLLSVFSYDGRVLRVEVSGNGKFLGCTGNKTVQVWDIESSQMLHELSGHTNDEIHGLAFSPEADLIVSGGKDGTIRVWNMNDGRQLQCIQAAKDFKPVHSLRVFPDSRTLAFISNGQVRFWDMLAERELAPLPNDANNPAMCGCLLPDGARYAIGYWDKTIRIWDIASRSEESRLGPHGDRLVTMAVTPDGCRIITGGGFQREGDDVGTGILLGEAVYSKKNEHFSLRVWNVRTGEEELAVFGHDLPVNHIVVSPDGRLVMTGSDDTTARLWDLVSGREVHCFQGHMHAVNSVDFSPDGTVVTTGASDGSVRIWDLSELNALHSPQHDSVDGIATVCYSQDGKWAVTAPRRIRPVGPRAVRVWEVATGLPSCELRGFRTMVTGVAVSHDHRKVAASGLDGVVRVWDMKSGANLLEFKGDKSYLRSITFSYDGSMLAGGGKHVAYVWDANTCEILHEFEGHDEYVVFVQFSSDGKALVTHDGETLRFWNLVTEKLDRRVECEGYEGVAISADGNCVAAGGLIGGYSVWDIKTGRLLRHRDGISDPAAYVDDGGQFPYDMGTTESEAFIVRSGQILTWLPIRFSDIHTHPSGSQWIAWANRVSDMHPYFIKLEGADAQ